MTAGASFRIFSALLLPLVLILPETLIAAELQPVPGVIHLESRAGGSPLSFDEVLSRVERAGIKIAFFNDKLCNRVEYGLPPMRRVLKVSRERDSISLFGPDNYLSEIGEAGRRNQGVLAFPGAEVAPFYYWDGSLFDFLRNLLADGGGGRILASGAEGEKIQKYSYRQNPADLGFKVVDYHKDILVLGLDKPDDYRNMPAVGNRKPLVFSWLALLSLWPLPLFVFALFRLFRSVPTAYPHLLSVKPAEDVSLSGYQQHRKRINRFSLFLLVISILFLVNNFPFLSPRYDQYHGGRGSAPYQDLIDYVNAKGGMTFWSAPDIDTGVFQVGPFKLETKPYSHELLSTRNYTGFAVFAEGMKATGIPGGVWDQVLTEYVNGKRERPVWAIGELDYEDGDFMGETQTVFMLKSVTREDAISALREGRVYAVTGSAQVAKPVLRHFQIWDDSAGHWVDMGGQANCNGSVKLRVNLELPPGVSAREIKIIREGQVVRVIPLSGSLDEVFEFPAIQAGGASYYRLDIDSSLVSNPIFCRTLSS